VVYVVRDEWSIIRAVAYCGFPMPVELSLEEYTLLAYDSFHLANDSSELRDRPVLYRMSKESILNRLDPTVSLTDSGRKLGIGIHSAIPLTGQLGFGKGNSRSILLVTR
jgi:hypothetical protein